MAQFPKTDVSFKTQEQTHKPPLGIKPLYIIVAERITEIQAAMTRYAEAKKDTPYQWVEELNFLTNWEQKRQEERDLKKPDSAAAKQKDSHFHDAFLYAMQVRKELSDLKFKKIFFEPEEYFKTIDDIQKWDEVDRMIQRLEESLENESKKPFAFFLYNNKNH